MEDIVRTMILAICQFTSHHVPIQWSLSIKDTLNKGHLSNEDTACSPNHINLYTNLPLN